MLIPLEDIPFPRQNFDRPQIVFQPAANHSGFSVTGEIVGEAY